MINFIASENKSKQMNFVDITVTNNCNWQYDFKVSEAATGGVL